MNDDRHVDLWKELDPSTNEHAKMYLAALQQSERDSMARASRSYYAFLVLVGVDLVIATQNVAELSLFAVKLKDVGLARLAMPLLLAFTYYSSFSQLVFGTLVRHMLDGYYSTYLPKVYASDLEMLVQSGSLISIERVFSREQWWGHRVANHFGYMLIVVSAIFPALYVLFALYRILPARLIWSPGTITFVAVSAITLMFLIRALLFVGHLGAERAGPRMSAP